MRADHSAWFLRAHHGDAVGALDVGERLADRLLQLESALAVLADQMRQHFRISLRLEYVALGLERCLQHHVVLDDAVVHQHDIAGAVIVRMGVHVVGLAVGRPARVGDAGVSFERLALEFGFEVADLTRCLHDLEAALLLDRHAGGIVAAILETLEPFHQDGQAIAMSDVSDDATHGGAPYEEVVAAGSVWRAVSISVRVRASEGDSAMTRTTGSVPLARTCSHSSSRLKRRPSVASTA